MQEIHSPANLLSLLSLRKQICSIKLKCDKSFSLVITNVSYKRLAGVIMRNDRATGIDEIWYDIRVKRTS